ncbi:MAG: transposase [Solirubrobacteraceae bacterium]
MPRQPRIELAGGIHHVFARGVRAAPVFLDADDRRRYLGLLERAVQWQGWRCLAYCLLTNHLHLLIETPTANLGTGMRRMHSDYALAFNKRHGYSGYLFQGRYGSVLVKDDPQLVAVVRYIDQNPVEAGLVSTAEAWPWSSAAALRGSPAPSWLAVERLRSIAPGGRIDLEPEGSVPTVCGPT